MAGHIEIVFRQGTDIDAFAVFRDNDLDRIFTWVSVRRVTSGFGSLTLGTMLEVGIFVDVRSLDQLAHNAAVLFVDKNNLTVLLLA
jgi:hypothetical protein